MKKNFFLSKKSKGKKFRQKLIPRLGIPSLRMNDGSVGVRWGHASAFPVGVALASTWDTAIVRKVGQGIGREVRAKGRNILLGPNLNIARNPLNGRTFESFGEDPYLTSQMGVSYIIGVRDEGIGATAKHFVANHYLLNTVLRNDWGFKGLIMSDWGAVHSTFPTVNNGLDLEMPTGKYLNPTTLLPALQSGKVKISTINSKVNKILTAEFRLHVLPEMKFPQHLTDSLLDAPITKETALQAANEGIVLLKNNNHILPILNTYNHEKIFD